MLDPSLESVVRTVDARAATAAVLLFLFAAMWLLVLSLAGWLGIPLWQIVVLVATQTAWIIGAALLAGWRWARLAAVVYAVFGLVLALWSASFGMTAEYTTFEWAFSAVAGVVAVLIGAIVAKPFAT